MNATPKTKLQSTLPAAVLLASMLVLSGTASAGFHKRLVKDIVKIVPVPIPDPTPLPIPKPTPNPIDIAKDVVEGENLGEAIQNNLHESLDSHNNAAQSAVDQFNHLHDEEEKLVRKALGNNAGDLWRLKNQPKRRVAQTTATTVAMGTELAKGKGLDSPVYIALAGKIRHAEATYFAESRPLPDHVKRKLRGRIPDMVLAQARYVAGHNVSLDVAEFLNAGVKLSSGADNAVTVGRVIVFAKDPGTDYDWWAHELGHVWQYNEWGIEEFAKKYVKNCPSLEREADKRVGLPPKQDTSCIG